MKKEELEAALAADDAVMDDGILKVLTLFIKSKGTPSAAIKLLSENFVGYGSMASLVCSWLKLVDQQQPLTAADVAQASSSGQGAPKDEFDFLAAFVKENFQPDVFNTVRGRGPPAWLDAVIALPRGRQLMYHLAATHTNCLLLGFAIQRILMQGHDAEVANVGSSLAGYFGVYHRLVKRHLMALLTGPESELAATLHELKTAASQGQHTYAYTQALLAALPCEHRASHALTRASQEIAVHAAKCASNGVYAMLPIFARRGDGELEIGAAALVGRVMSSSNRNSLSPGDLQQLIALYKGDRPPPARLLQHPRLFELLIDAVYPIGVKPSANFVDAALELLAMAATLCDEDLGRAPPSVEGGGPQPSGGAGAPGTEERPRDSEGWREMATTRACLVRARDVLHAAFTLAYKGASHDEVDLAVDAPVAAAALIRAIHAAFRDEDFYTETYNLAAIQHLLLILFRIARRHPRCHMQLVSLAIDALRAVGGGRQECAKALLQLLLQLLQMGRVEEVLTAIQGWVPLADLSLARVIVFEILKTCKAPYSPRFAALLLSLMARSGVRRRRDPGHLRDTQSELLTQFASDVASLTFEPPLPERERTFLKELSNELYY